MIHPEQVLLEHLNDPESLDYLSQEGFHQSVSLAVVPTELVRKITGWAISYYWENGRKVGPSHEATKETWGDQMEAMEIAFGDPTDEIDSIEWAVQALRSQYAVSQSQKLNREMATRVARADQTGKVEAIIDGAREFHRLVQALSSRRDESEAGLAFEAAVLRHEDRRVSGHHQHGLTLGMDLIDNHTLGVHPGELAAFAMTTGGGKSWIAGKVLLNEWRRGRRAVLVTLENDLEMTSDRLACMYAHVDYTRWQRGEAKDDEVFRVLEAAEQLKASEHQPVITMIQANERDPLSIVRRAHTLGAESLIVDQLSHIESVPGTKSRERHQQVAEIMRELKAQIRDDAVGRLPCLLLAQINRAGRDAARKSGRYELEHLGLSTEVENTVDHLWAGYQSADHEVLQRAVWQFLKFRRGPKVDFDMRWRLDVGDIRALNVAERDST
jgi:hypothetical protein